MDGGLQLICPEISGFLEDTALASRRQLLLLKGKEGLCVCVCGERGLRWSDRNGESEEGTKKEKKKSKAMVFTPLSIKQTLRKKTQQPNTKNRRSLQWLLSKQGN